MEKLVAKSLADKVPEVDAPVFLSGTRDSASTSRQGRDRQPHDAQTLDPAERG